MDTMYKNKLLVCPYDEAHKVKGSRMQLHITRCKMNHLNEMKFTCPFNATHVMPYQEKDYHLLHCPDKAPLDRLLAESLDKNNPCKGRTAVPSYSEVLPFKSDESWEVEEEYDEMSGYLPIKERPPGAVVHPAPFLGSSVKKKLYQKLHHQSQNISFNPYLDSGSSISAPVPRQPKQPSQVSRFEDLPCPGIGRGKASKFAQLNFLPATTNDDDSVKSYSSVVDGTKMNNINSILDQQNTTVGLNHVSDEIPVLGFGRGTIRNRAAVHSAKQ